MSCKLGMEVGITDIGARKFAFDLLNAGPVVPGDNVQSEALSNNLGRGL
jgi:hypothetical protein